MRWPEGAPGLLGGLGVTPREAEILRAVGQRLNNREIAERFCISIRTVESHIASLRSKLGVASRAELRQRCLDIKESEPAERTRLPPALAAHVANGPFVGRERELDVLHRAWRTAIAGQRRVALVTGDAGGGKSRLVAEFGRIVAETAAIRFGRCDEELDVPYQPFTELLQADLSHSPPDRLLRLDQTEVAVLTRIVPDIGARTASPGTGPHPDTSPADRRRLYDAVTAYLRSAALVEPMVVILEDLHWAPPATIGLIRHVIAALKATPVLIVMTYRQADLDPVEPLAELVADLRRHPDTDSIPVEQLTLDDVRALATLAGYGHHAEAIHHRTSGNAYFVTELVRSLDSAGDGDGVPAGVRDIVNRRIGRLPHRTRQLLELAAVAGPRADLQVLGSVSGLAIEQVLIDLEPAERAAVIHGNPEQPGTLTFAHGIARDAITTGLGTAKALSLHRDIAAALRERHQAGDRRSTAELARHLFAAAPLGDRSVAARYLIEAAELATATLAYDEAAEEYGRALQVLAMETVVDPAMACDLRTARATALYRAGDPRHQGEFLAAAQAAVRIGDPLRVTAILIARTPSGFTSRWGQVDRQLLKLIDWALERLDEQALTARAELTAIKAAELTLTDPGRAGPLSDEALAAARRSGDRRALGHVLQRHYWATYDPDNVADRLASTTELVDLGAELNDLPLMAYGRVVRAETMLLAGDLNEARRDFSEAGLLAQQLAQPHLTWIVATKTAGLAMLAGDLAAAQSLADQALQLSGEEFRDGPTVMHLAQTCLLQIIVGHPEQAVTVARALTERNPSLTWRGWLAHAYLAAGQQRNAAIELERAARDFTTVRRGIMWRAAMHAFANVAMGLHDTERAGKLYGLLQPSTGRIDWFGGGSYGPSDLPLGQLAALLGDNDQAGTHLKLAVEVCRNMQAEAWLAYSLVAQAQLEIQCDRPGRARDLAIEAEHIADQLGIPSVASQSRALLA